MVHPWPENVGNILSHVRTNTKLKLRLTYFKHLMFFI